MEQTGVRLLIHGRVQGVFFRASCAARAKHLGLSGWVRNRADGSVEVVIVGAAPAVEDLARWCGTGPEGARVDRVVRETFQAPMEAGGFTVR